MRTQTISLQKRAIALLSALVLAISMACVAVVCTVFPSLAFADAESYELNDGAMIVTIDQDSATATFDVIGDVCFYASQGVTGQKGFYEALVAAGMSPLDSYKDLTFPGIKRIVITGNGCYTVCGELGLDVWPDLEEFDMSQSSKSVLGTQSRADVNYMKLLPLLEKVSVPAGVPISVAWTAYAEDSTYADWSNWSFETLNGSTGGSGILKKIVLPSTLKNLGDPVAGYASSSALFLNNGTLAEVEFAEGTELDYIQERAFQNCTSLESIVLPDTVDEIGAGLFIGCSNLKSVVLPSTIGTIKDSGTSDSLRRGMFEDCSSLETVTLPFDVDYPDITFRNCSSLQSITITGAPTSDAVNESLIAALEYAGIDVDTLDITVEAESWYVNFDTGEGSAVDTILVPSGEAIGETVAMPVDPTWEGYEFTGWYMDAAYTELYVDQPITADTTLYAKWKDAPVTVTFDSQGGTAVDSITVEKGGVVEKPVDPTRENYNFTGWYTDKDCTEEYDFESLVEGDMTLYAGWEEVEADDPTDPANPDDSEDSTDPTDSTGDQDTTTNDQGTTTDNESASTSSSGTSQTTALSKVGDDSTLGFGLAGFFAALASLGGVFAYRKCRAR